jgi:secreted PhoX family phosphatase
MMRTAADPEGVRVLGTMNNCAHGFTPWGTYLTCEENFINYFAAGDNPDAHARRWGARKETPYRWAEFDERFDMTRHPNEFNRFGWVVEIDPMDPTSTPIKRTALGRAAHEGATVTTSKDGRAVVYMGEDASAPVAPQPTATCWTTARSTWRALTPAAAASGSNWPPARVR